MYYVITNVGGRISRFTASIASQLSPMAFQRRSLQVPAEPYRFPHDASLGPDTTALVVIDMQRDCERSLVCP